MSDTDGVPYGSIIKMITEEMLEEISERVAEDPAGGLEDVLTETMLRCSAMTVWVATGAVPAAARDDAFMAKVALPAAPAALEAPLEARVPMDGLVR